MLCSRFVVLLDAMQCLNQDAILLFVLPLTTGEFFYQLLYLMFSLFDKCFRHTGLGSDPGLYPDYILALHSSKRLLAEQLSSSYHLLVMFICDCIISISMKEISQQADSIISLTVARGQRHEGREGMTAYYLTKVIVMMIINMVMTKVMMIMIWWPWS